MTSTPSTRHHRRSHRLMSHRSTKRGVPVAAWASVFLFLGIGGYLGHRATLLEMPRGEEEFFPKQHMFTGFANSMARDYEVGASSEYTEVAYTFGVSGLRRENYDEYAPDYKRGEARWSGGFDVFEFRDELQGFCDAVRAAPCHERECGMGLLHVPESTTCFYEEFEAWKMSGFGTVPLANMTSLDFYNDLALFRETTYPAAWKSNFYGAFVLNNRVILHAIDAMPARWRGDAGSSPLDRAPDALVDFHTGTRA